MWLMKLKLDWDWRKLLNNPPDCNEDPKLELSRDWEPLDSSEPLQIGKG
jgi:hypothetical protein